VAAAGELTSRLAPRYRSTAKEELLMKKRLQKKLELAA
jgi:hypothetical protein